MNFSGAEMQALHDEAAFAETWWLGETARVRPSVDSTRLFKCGCPEPRLWRKRRKIWMRLLPFVKLYECERCGTRVLAGKISMRRVKSVYLRCTAMSHFLNTQVGGSSFEIRQFR